MYGEAERAVCKVVLCSECNVTGAGTDPGTSEILVNHEKEYKTVIALMTDLTARLDIRALLPGGDW